MTTHPYQSVVLAGGGSAGHVSPLLALADCLRRRDPQVRITALGTEQGLEARLIPPRGYDLRFVPKVPMPRKPSADLLRLPQRLSGAIAAAGAAIDETQADVVVGFGGYVSTPAYLAAKQRGVPIVIHEQNARPGLANRLGARFAARTTVTFPNTPLPRAQVVGMPLRPEITGLDRHAARDAAAHELGVDPQLPTLLITGGSLGAQRLNETFAERVSALSQAGIQVVHVSGLGKEFEAVTPAGGAPYVVMPYAERMQLVFAVADLVVARAGANTVCELTALGLPALYVPLPIGNGEQRLNAAAVVAAGGGIIVDDAAVNPTWVDSTVIPLMHDPDRLQQMADAAASVGQCGGDELLADAVAEAALTRTGSRT